MSLLADQIDTGLLVNPWRVDCAMRRREMTSKALAEKLGLPPRVVAKWRKPSGYTLHLAMEEIERLSSALEFPVGWFTAGDEETDFANGALIDASIARHWGGDKCK
jgi:hypothetical protein